MNISYNWLKKYIDIPYTPKDLADKMTMAGIEVEAMTESNNIPDGIVVAEIIERSPHPNADKLSVCRVTTGNDTEHQIVCGAPNCDAGTKVPLATLGTVFADPETGKKLKIKKTKLRGVESFGMLCSAKELKIADDHAGLLELPNNTEVGVPLSRLFQTDIAYELEITPNRPDCLSHWGIAREIAAYTGNDLKFPAINLPELGSSIRDDQELVTIQDAELCPRYTARIIRNVKVSESPEWLKQYLLSIGLRPINNIVDITNFVMFELGQPLHAFDLDDLEEKRIIVRRANKNEKFVALDDQEYELDDTRLVIADAKKPVALAGVMGGVHSGVTETTTNILLESAAFDQSNVRVTSRELGASSDSSYRFERGIDFDMVTVASNRASSLILQLAGGELATELVDKKEEQPEIKPILCRFDKINKLIGIEISNERIVDIFENLGFAVGNIQDFACEITPPAYRQDVTREADLSEEVARIYGLENIPHKKISTILGGSIKEDSYAKLEVLRNELISLGLDECLNYVLISKKQALSDGRFAEDELLSVANPISTEGAVMRPSTLYGILDNIKNNVAHSNHDLTIFEVGKVFSTDKNYPEERLEGCIAIAGRKHPERFSDEKDQAFDFFDMKGLLESWLDNRKITRVYV